jgi:N-methylhydantoinase A
MPVHLDEARMALEEKIARPLGMAVQRAAEGIIAVVNANMIRGIRRVSVERGYDPREFALVAFGGAGPMHGVELAEAVSMREVVIPAHPGIASAFGMLSADVRHDFVRTHVTVSQHAVAVELLSLFQDMEEQGRTQLNREGFSGPCIVVNRSVDMRYVRQAYELSVPIKGGPLTASDIGAIAKRFHELHQKAYGYARKQDPVEFVSLRVVALGTLPQFNVPEEERLPGQSVEPAAYRQIILGGEANGTPIYRREDLRCGGEIRGPAIVEQMDSTTVICPGFQAVTDPYGNLLIRKSPKR